MSASVRSCIAVLLVAGAAAVGGPVQAQPAPAPPAEAAVPAPADAAAAALEATRRAEVDKLTTEAAALKAEAIAADAVPAQTKLAPTYPQFTTGGSAGLPWYTKGASLSVPFQLGAATNIDDASAEVRYTIDGFDGGFAIEKSSVALLSSSRGGAPVTASAAMFAMRVAFGDATRRGRACTQTEAALSSDTKAVPSADSAAGPCAQITDGDYRVALGRSGSIGARAGAVTIDDHASAVFALEAVGEHTAAEWSAFGSLTAELVADNRAATERYYGGGGGHLTLGARFGTFNRVGALVSGGVRAWSHGPARDYSVDYSIDVMLFGVFEQVRLGAGVTRALNAGAAADAQAFVPTVWLSPQI